VIELLDARKDGLEGGAGLPDPAPPTPPPPPVLRVAIAVGNINDGLSFPANLEW
jgi:hypothetical protein